jgi:glycosyltransferase involved in cell wall biosynthesis
LIGRATVAPEPSKASPPLSLGIALPFLDPGRAGGGELATEVLVRSLDRAAGSQVGMAVLCSRSNLAWLRRQSLGNTTPAVVRTSVPANTLLRGATLAMHARVTSPVGRALKGRYDVIHFPLVPAVPVPGTPVAATVWDLQHHDLPGNYTALTRLYRRWAYDAVTRVADVVLAPTSVTAERIQAILPRGRAEVRVLVPGVLESHAPLDTTGARDALQALGTDRPFIYYPAIWWPHKNHDTLFAAMRNQPEEVALVLSGGDAKAVRDATVLAARHGIEARVKHVGHVSGAVVRGLYRLARAVAYPSAYEGFGIPPIEAMAQGTPVIASDLPVLREVIGRAAIFVDHESATELAAAIAAVLEESPERERLRREGTERARLYGADLGAERHIAEYRRLSGGAA